MNSFMEGIQTKVEGIKEVYECGNILIKEDIDTRMCKAYNMQNGEKINNEEIRVFLANIEDERDIISYKILFLPGGRYKKINEQEGVVYIHFVVYLVHYRVKIFLDMQ